MDGIDPVLVGVGGTNILVVGFGRVDVVVIGVNASFAQPVCLACLELAEAGANFDVGIIGFHLGNHGGDFVDIPV